METIDMRAAAKLLNIGPRELLDGTPPDELEPSRPTPPAERQGLPRQQSTSGRTNSIRGVATGGQSQYARDIIRSLRG